MSWLTRRVSTPARLLIATLVSFAVILGWAVMAGELLELAERPDGATAVDSSITSWVVAHRTPSLTSVAQLLSTLGSQTVLIPLTAIATVALLGRRRYVPAGLLVAAWSGAIGLYSLTKHFVHRARPPMDLWLIDVRHTSSFPSGHATQSLATLLALAGALMYSARRPGRAVALGLAIGVGWSRVYLGVHWATDVCAGWLIAAAWLTSVVWLARAAGSMRRRLRRKRRLET